MARQQLLFVTGLVLAANVGHCANDVPGIRIASVGSVPEAGPRVEDLLDASPTQPMAIYGAYGHAAFHHFCKQPHSARWAHRLPAHPPGQPLPLLPRQD